MNRSTSLYLDAARFIAAVAVFQSHASLGPWTGGMLWQLRPLGMEAVVIFFVLSGIVIGFVTSQREQTASVYSASRLARIYSVCSPALIITFALDALGRYINPEFYINHEAYGLAKMLGLLIAGLTFTTNVWWNHIWIGINSPYWSMGYEVPYYIVFGFTMFLPRYYGLAAAVLLLVVIGPNVSVLFPIWLLGFFSYRICAKTPLKPGNGLALWAGSTIGMAAHLVSLKNHHALWEDFSFDPVRLRDYGHFYITAILFAINVVGFHGAAPYFDRAISKATRPIRWCAQTTFAFYLLHLPVIQFVAAVEPWPPEFWIKRVSIFIGVPVVVMLAAWVIERRKNWWRRAFSRLLGMETGTSSLATRLISAQTVEHECEARTRERKLSIL